MRGLSSLTFLCEFETEPPQPVVVNEWRETAKSVVVPFSRERPSRQVPTSAFAWVALRDAGREVIVRKTVIVAVLAASLGLSACGAAAKATLDGAVASLGSSADLQVHLTASASGAGSAQAQTVLAALSLDARFSNPTGSALSDSSQANCELIVNAGGQALLDVRDVAGTLYAEVDLTALANVPSANVSPSQIAALQALFGGRWFEFPQSLIATYFPKTAASAAQAAKEQAATSTIFDALSALVDAAPYTTLANGGLSQTGTLESVATAVLPAIEGVSGEKIPVGSVPGTYTVTLTTSGSAATGGSIAITAPNGTKGNESVELDATVTHDSDAITAPTGATVITSTLLKGLLAQAT